MSQLFYRMISYEKKKRYYTKNPCFPMRISYLPGLEGPIKSGRKSSTCLRLVLVESNDSLFTY